MKNSDGPAFARMQLVVHHNRGFHNSLGAMPTVLRGHASFGGSCLCRAIGMAPALLIIGTVSFEMRHYRVACWAVAPIL